MLHLDTKNKVLSATVISILLLGMIAGLIVIPTAKAGSVSANPTYTFTIASNSTSNYVLARNGSIMSSGSVDSVFSAAFGYIKNGENLTVRSGEYIAANTLLMSSGNNLLINFEYGSLLTLANGVDASVLRLNYCNNILIQGVNIDGNSANEYSNYLSDGVLFYDSGNCTLTNSNITNCAGNGFAVMEEHYMKPSNTISNTNITYCHWNGMTIGHGAGYLNATYVLNNDISHCTDVGITLYITNNTVVSNNYIHDMDGTLLSAHSGGGASWGIGRESSGAMYAQFINNTIVNCETGIDLADGQSSLVKGNNITNCNNPIMFDGYADQSYNNGFNVITQNTFVNWNYRVTYHHAAIFCYHSDQNIFSFNTFINTNATLSPAETI